MFRGGKLPALIAVRFLNTVIFSLLPTQKKTARQGRQTKPTRLAFGSNIFNLLYHSSYHVGAPVTVPTLSADTRRLMTSIKSFQSLLLSSVIFVNENENENAKTAKLVTQRKC